MKRSYEDKVRLLQMENDRMDDMIRKGSDMDRRYKDAMGELENVRTQLLFKDEQCRNLEKRLDDAEHKLRMLSGENELKKKALWEATGEKDVAKDGFKRLENELADRDRQLRQEREENDRKDRKINELNSEIRNVNSEKDSISLTIKEKIGRNEGMQREYKDMEDELRRLLDENEKLETLLIDREDELDALRSEYVEIEDKVVNELLPKVNMVINENDRLSQTLDERNKELGEWKRRYDELEAQKNKRIQELEQELFRNKSEVSR